ncbi:putative CENP-B N-terminal DNA-binding domain-containing protein 17 [Homarus americanus]|uniref:Putative CENP-B N-terminal DNA-binding domain-containing protein 17 n=1 Tax=Homarus americanus TaxID=6706 RepID=A0A8J5MZN6_HOMAM|nr:putative CENP-B N-terminal DNA-binding domain-containing protein 17 [Homarus americanus]
MSEVRNVNVGNGSGGNDGRREGQQGKPQAKHDYRKGVKKRKYTLEIKREMLEKIKSGACTCEIMCRFNCPESTIRSLKKNKEALIASTDSLVELQQIEAELDDGDQALPAEEEEEEEEEEMVDGLTPSTSPPCNREVLSVSNSEISGTEQTAAHGERQSMAATLMDKVEAARSVPAPGFLDVQVDDLQEIVGQHQQQPTIEKMLEDDEEQEEQQPTQEYDVKPGESTTHQLTDKHRTSQ